MSTASTELDDFTLQSADLVDPRHPKKTGKSRHRTTRDTVLFVGGGLEGGLEGGLPFFSKGAGWKHGMLDQVPGISVHLLHHMLKILQCYYRSPVEEHGRTTEE